MRIRAALADDTLANLSYERREAFWHEAIINDDAPQRVFVAEEDELIVGFASCGPERTNNPDYTGELYAIYLFQQNQGKGIGRALTHAVANRLWELGHAGMLVWVLEHNPSRKFYEALGWQEVECKPISIGSVDLIEVAYGWRSLEALL